MLSDAQWAALEPLVDLCRPKAKTPPQDLQRTLSAILWRHQNGAKWRAIPEELGPWWRGADLHPVGAGRRVGASARPGAGARRPARHGVSRWHQHARASEGSGCR